MITAVYQRDEVHRVSPPGGLIGAPGLVDLITAACKPTQFWGRNDDARRYPVDLVYGRVHLTVGPERDRRRSGTAAGMGTPPGRRSLSPAPGSAVPSPQRWNGCIVMSSVGPAVPLHGGTPLRSVGVRAVATNVASSWVVNATVTGAAGVGPQ